MPFLPAGCPDGRTPHTPVCGIFPIGEPPTTPTRHPPEHPLSTSLYDFEALSIDGHSVPLAQYRGHPLLIVNTASACGFTPQFAGLEQLHQSYGARGLVVLGFPCNQFGSQDPGSNDEIASFCQRNFGVTFPMMSKIDVNGADAHPLYRWLSAEAPGLLGSKAIKWNFTKFLVGKDGTVIKRYAPQDAPEKLAKDIEAALG
ncbi:MAG: glutathione peroxidase [Comamonadaceae bacterium]|nr:glutathione peroxidase [Comamonadaceae bacterium]